MASSNGVMSAPQPPRSAGTHHPRVILAGSSARILCVADIRGDYHELNRLIREHEATAVIHTGDFGFLNADSLERMGDNSSIHFPLSQFPHLLSGAITFPVPVFTVWGLIEDVRIVEKFRTGEYEVNNLTVIDEASSALIEASGIKLRLFGLGGAVAMHKLFRYPASLNDYAIYGDFDSYRQKLVLARDNFVSVGDAELTGSEQQHALLKKVLGMVQKIPTSEDNAWTNTWHWVLTDAMCGHLLLEINDGRVSAETRSNGLNFAHRANQAQQPPTAPVASGAAAPLAQSRPEKPIVGAAGAKSVPPKPIGTNAAPSTSAAKSSGAGPKMTGSPTQAATRGLRPVKDAKSEKGELKPTDRSSSAAGKAKASPSSTPVPLPKEKKEKTNGEKPVDGGEESEGKATPKRFSLYLKGLPTPTSEAEVKAFMGPAGEKAIGIKLVYDHMRRQKNFAYVDYANEQEMQDALKLAPVGVSFKHREIANSSQQNIRDSPVTVELSNPPVRGLAAERGRGSRAGSRRAGRGGSAGSKEAFKEGKDGGKSETPKPEGGKEASGAGSGAGAAAGGKSEDK
ncbi:hypothetical protein A1Q1_02249 [Trichosporon asahii var. asahii CBS 2479]|uniref:RRM domain-containing protein n=1 Tax=Trichosporon asahii var. asahii (strain ATCC 90039 / CBS 2479 / JCM 2466 / KCTC 7840 / NBRC 103889/ NCYC 2677 / UAMH 7654) TaxID=1186058 RepID=J6EVR9_TRIAS|nr:hypothetical protein A1Q1_02249 [Trichosporon asahii var. asahii CBS 2479]EJT48704.1 hypothetical protein A1Q1_02249 [Trichosporon asahii var. asahii CBS 2479]